MAEPLPAQTDRQPLKWGKVVDHASCIGCHACTTACKSENDVPLSVTRTYVKYVDVGVFPQARRAYQVTRCNQCEDPPCVAACPTQAMHQRPDGIVDFDKSICIGCKACIASCPYDAIFINPEDHSAEKCNFCAHRLDVGLEPACVVVCPTEAIMIGDMNDADLSGGTDGQSTTGCRPTAGEGDTPEALLPGRSSGHSRSSRGPQAHRWDLHVEPAEAGRPERGVGQHRRRQLLRCGRAGVRRASQGPLGLAGEPLHPDQGALRWRLLGSGSPGSFRKDRPHQRALDMDRTDRRRRLPGL